MNCYRVEGSERRGARSAGSEDGVLREEDVARGKGGQG